MSTKLAFKTIGGVVPAGQSQRLGAVDVSQFSKIRVVAVDYAGSHTGVSFRLTITEGALVAQLDTLYLTPHSEVTRVYDVPGLELTIFADAVGGTGSDKIDLLVYGN